MDQMKEQEDMYCRDWRKWCYGDWRRRYRIGIFLIIIGALWMGSKLGFFNPAIFWPLALITIGIWIIVSSVLRDKKSTHSTPQSEAWGMLRVDTEGRFLPRFKNRGLAPSNVSK